MSRFSKTLLGAVGYIIVLGSLFVVLAQDEVIPPFDINRVKLATVFIAQTQTVGTTQQIVCISSGTLVSRDGLILTNAHSTVSSVDCGGDTLVVYVSASLESPPQAAYQAQIIQYDAGIDLVLLQIHRGFDGRSINKSELSLPFVELADSDLVRLDETLTIVGYPDIGDDPVRESRVVVQGFTAEPSGGAKSWLKFRAQDDSGDIITGAMTGGGAYNRRGQLVGIPTTAPVTRQGGSACKRVQDTNADGLININDYCVPIGGSINVLRPANFARTLLRGASLGINVTKLTDTAAQRTTLAGEPRIGTPFFAPSLTNNMPTTVVNAALPSGIDSLYLFFDYQNMTPETVYELRVTVNGRVNPIFSLTSVRWSGGERGLWYIGSTGQVWPNGDYEFTVFINGVAASEPRTIRIAGTAIQEPTFSSISFGLTEGNQMFSSGPVLGTGNTVRAQFIYNNMTETIAWTAIWYYNGAELQRSSDTWGAERGSNGSENIGLTVDPLLLPGQYRLELYIDTRLAAMSDFTVAGARDPTLPLPRVFDRSKMRFVTSQTPQEAITARPITTFTNPLDTLYALFSWEQISPGTLWRMRWSVDEQPFYDQIVPWSSGENGDNYITQLSSTSGIPDGTYRMELYIQDVLLGSIEVDIGIGQLPIDPFADPGGVNVSGQILDAQTGLGIPNVTFIVISEEFSVADYTALIEQVYTMGTSDRSGRFVLERPLQYEAPYSLYISAYGYAPMTADGFELIEDETPNPLNMTIYLSRE